MVGTYSSVIFFSISTYILIEINVLQFYLLLYTDVIYDTLIFFKFQNKHLTEDGKT